LTKLAKEGSSQPSPFCEPEIIIKHVFVELDTTPQALALAWVAKNTNTGSVILGASSPKQLLENLKAVQVMPKLTPEIMEKIEKILQNKPAPPVSAIFF
jgi:aryl-alcohol dehydrogenase-like predicted oxidoreductase